jgi:hypothetical protein
MVKMAELTGHTSRVLYMAQVIIWEPKLILLIIFISSFNLLTFCHFPTESGWLHSGNSSRGWNAQILECFWGSWNCC